MFLVRRICDGKFLRNRRVSTLDPESQWTDDISECKPFRTRSVARHTWQINIPNPIKKPAERDFHSVANRAEWDQYYREMEAWQHSSNKKIRDGIWNQIYEVVELEFKLKENENG